MKPVLSYSNKKNGLILVSFLAVLLLAGFLFISLQKNPAAEKPQESLPFEPALTNERTDYGIPQSVFEDLPGMPQDFQALVPLMQENRFTNYSFFQEEYFLQPEFYAGFKENALNYWINPNPTHRAVSGYGFYPLQQQIALRAGETTTASFFMHSGWGVQSVQGTKIIQTNPQGAIKITILEPEFLLGYSFPKFSRTWAKKVTVTIKADESILPGKYDLVFSVTNPSQENREKWTAETERGYYDIGFSSVLLTSTITVKVI